MVQKTPKVAREAFKRLQDQSHGAPKCSKRRSIDCKMPSKTLLLRCQWQVSMRNWQFTVHNSYFAINTSQFIFLRLADSQLLGQNARFIVHRRRLTIFDSPSSVFPSVSIWQASYSHCTIVIHTWFHDAQRPDWTQQYKPNWWHGLLTTEAKASPFPIAPLLRCQPNWSNANLQQKQSHASKCTDVIGIARILRNPIPSNAILWQDSRLF